MDDRLRSITESESWYAGTGIVVLILSLKIHAKIMFLSWISPILICPPMTTWDHMHLKKIQATHYESKLTYLANTPPEVNYLQRNPMDLSN